MPGHGSWPSWFLLLCEAMGDAEGFLDRLYGYEKRVFRKMCGFRESVKVILSSPLESEPIEKSS